MNESNSLLVEEYMPLLKNLHKIVKDQCTYQK